MDGDDPNYDTNVPVNVPQHRLCPSLQQAQFKPTKSHIQILTDSLIQNNYECDTVSEMKSFEIESPDILQYFAI